jgi:hypothetical protein
MMFNATFNKISDGRLITSRQSLTQFFKSTSNKWKLQGSNGDHETTNKKLSDLICSWFFFYSQLPKGHLFHVQSLFLSTLTIGSLAYL